MNVSRRPLGSSSPKPPKSASSSLLLRLTGTSFGYGRNEVLAGVNLSVHTGELIGLSGENGGGKSTLLHGVLGLLPPRSGSREVQTRRLGYVPQRDALDPLYPWSAFEVVLQGAYGRLEGLLQKIGSSVRDEAKASLERVGMTELAKAPFASLSGGQRQRILIARALMMKPDLLALDEPTSGLDAGARSAIFELMCELRDEGRGLVLVSHDWERMAAVAGTMYRVGNGRVELVSEGVRTALESKA